MIIEAAFETYRKQVIPKDAGPVQQSETKQAFFGGASIVVQTILDAMDLDDENQTQEEILDRLAETLGELSGEAVEFKNQLLNSN